MAMTIDYQNLNEELRKKFSKSSKAIFEDVLNAFALQDVDKKILSLIYVKPSQQLAAKSICESMNSIPGDEIEKRISILTECQFLKRVDKPKTDLAFIKDISDKNSWAYYKLNAKMLNRHPRSVQGETENILAYIDWKYNNKKDPGMKDILFTLFEYMNIQDISPQEMDNSYSYHLINLGLADKRQKEFQLLFEGIRYPKLKM